MSEAQAQQMLTLEQAYRAAFYLTDQYVSLESAPDVGLVLFHQYLQSDPARWENWLSAVWSAMAANPPSDPVTENLDR